MTNLIKFPTKLQRTERELDELMKLLKVPSDVNPEIWEEVAVREIKSFLRLPSASKSFNMVSMTKQEASIFENELHDFIKEYSFEVIKPAIITVANLYAQLLKKS